MMAEHCAAYAVVLSEFQNYQIATHQLRFSRSNAPKLCFRLRRGMLPPNFPLRRRLSHRRPDWQYRHFFLYELSTALCHAVAICCTNTSMYDIDSRLNRMTTLCSIQPQKICLLKCMTIDYSANRIYYYAVWRERRRPPSWWSLPAESLVTLYGSCKEQSLSRGRQWRFGNSSLQCWAVIELQVIKLRHWITFEVICNW